jgi:thiosulfate/3-mercaptopyruvate sulfurtransferase
MTLRLRMARVLCGVVLAAWLPMAVAQSATELPAAHLVSPEELVQILKAGRAKPLILNVGPHMLYQQAHIPGAEFIGPGSDPEALRQLHQRAQPLQRSAFIVLYCGCCPWTVCPNVNPAYTELQRMGFRNVKVLRIASDFGTDWVYKSYPTVRGNP